MGLEEKIEKAKEKLSKTPVNKATEKERGRLKAKIAKLKQEKEQKQKGTGATHQGYSVEKHGDATVALVGYPSVGKSLLLNKLTNADSEVGSYHFTTLDVVPGIIEYKGAKIQLLDVPGLIGGAAKDKGGGKQILSVIRNCDMVVLMTDPARLDGFEKMEEELYNAGIRLNQQPPDIKVVKKGKGGINISSTVDLPDLDRDTIEEVMEEWGYTNASVVIREKVDLERFIDGIAQNRVYMPSLKVVNKVDMLEKEQVEKIREKTEDPLFISAEKEKKLEKFKEGVFNSLGMMRVYLKKKGKKPDKDEPLILREGNTVKDLCEELHDKFLEKFKHARVWGSSAKFKGQQVGLDHELDDEDVVEITRE